MNKPDLVAECVSQLKQSVSIPITVKCRLGIDKTDDYEFLHHFVDKVARAGCELFIVHARKAWLKGLNPKQNRTVPPLNYEQVYLLKKNFPHLTIIINGGITDMDSISRHCEYTDGVMIGREAYNNPYFLREIDQLFYKSEEPPLSREEIAIHFIPYLQKQGQDSLKLASIIKHLFGLFHGVEKAKIWRKTLIEGIKEARNGSEVIFRAMTAMK
jgi:tRNA-dihydrouridine synthase A